MTALLQISALFAGYGGVPVLKGLDLSVERGAIVAILGANGAGKSTLLRAVMGELATAGGTIRLAGRDITRAAVEARSRAGIAYVPEGRRVFAGLTVRENLEVASRRSAGQRARDVAEIFALFPTLAERPRARAWQLSGGQQQMLSVGRALMTGPALMLLDEPTLGLAPTVAADIATRLQAIADGGVSVLVVEQNAARLRGLKTRQLTLAGGRLTAGATETLSPGN